MSNGTTDEDGCQAARGTVTVRTQCPGRAPASEYAIHLAHAYPISAGLGINLRRYRGVG